MNLASQICEALCKGFTVRKVSMGFAVQSPFDWFTGDKMIFYARTKGALIRFEDNGATLFELQGAGVDLTSVTRISSIRELCIETNITYDEAESSFYTDWVTAESVGLSAIKFMSFMTRIQDLLFTVKDRVASTFKDDLIAAVHDRFDSEAIVETNSAPVPELSYYLVDVVVRHKNGKTAAIFPATSEEKALGAVLFSKELELKKIENVIPFLVFEKTFGGPRVNKDTQSKAMNSELQLATWEGGKIEVIDKIARHVA